jgi:hypothetical protein
MQMIFCGFGTGGSNLIPAKGIGFPFLIATAARSKPVLLSARKRHMPVGSSGSASCRSTIDLSWRTRPMRGPVGEANETSRMGISRRRNEIGNDLRTITLCSRYFRHHYAANRRATQPTLSEYLTSVRL